jgi:excisionase family DNA binding protein
MKMEKLLVRPVEAAAMLSVSRSSIYELIASGAVPSVRVGNMLRVPVSAIRKLSEANGGDAAASR